MRIDRVSALIVIPAKAGIQPSQRPALDPRLRGSGLTPSPSRGGLGWGWVIGVTRGVALFLCNPIPTLTLPLKGRGQKTSEPR